MKKEKIQSCKKEKQEREQAIVENRKSDAR